MRAFVLGLLLAATLAADTHQVTKTSYPGGEAIATQDFQGNNFRVLDKNGSRSMVMIRNQQGFFELDLQARQYVQLRPQSEDFILFLAQWIARPPRIHESGKTVNIFYEVVDTGDRRRFFGHAARRLRVIERHVAERGACDQTYRTEKAGWYIPRDESRGPQKGSVRLIHFGLLRSTVCHDKIVIHGDPEPPGIAVLETDGPMTRQVLEYSDSPLDKSLFQVPGSFKKVDALPGQRPTSWLERTDQELTQLQRAFESWFQ
jgi:hypothetical protein